MKTIRLLILSFAAAIGMNASAQLLDAAVPESPFGLGVRVGVNTSNISNNYADAIDGYDWTTTSWKTGFTAGVVADLKLRNYIAIQPGFFFQSRNMDYRNMVTETVPGGVSSMESQDGHVRSYNFNIPIMVSLRLGLSSILQARAEFGPYFAFGLGGNNKCTSTSVGVNGELGTPVTYKTDIYGGDGYMRGFDWGFKMGVGFVFAKKYYLGVHYEAGCRNVYKQPENVRHDLKGHNKAWDVTFGYTIF